MLNIFMYYTPPLFNPVNVHYSSYLKHVFSIREENSVDSDQKTLSEAS